jgi:hypothetical protein
MESFAVLPTVQEMTREALRMAREGVPRETIEQEFDVIIQHDFPDPDEADTKKSLLNDSL